jgi:transposase
VKNGHVIRQCLPRHRAKEFIMHLILDNYSTHKTKQVQNWLKRHKRFKLHFIPTSSSWLNLVERFFALITEDAIRREPPESSQLGPSNALKEKANVSILGISLRLPSTTISPSSARWN